VVQTSSGLIRSFLSIGEGDGDPKKPGIYQWFGAMDYPFVSYKKRWAAALLAVVRVLIERLVAHGHPLPPTP
jgi:hypothetical protein